MRRKGRRERDRERERQRQRKGGREGGRGREVEKEGKDKEHTPSRIVK